MDRQGLPFCLASEGKLDPTAERLFLWPGIQVCRVLKLSV